MWVNVARNQLTQLYQFHRVKEYVKLEAEEKHDETYTPAGEYADDETQVISQNWPQNGELEFRNVTIRYEEEGPNILTDINLKFKAGERVAIVGRTGSGKSTVSGDKSRRARKETFCWLTFFFFLQARALAFTIYPYCQRPDPVQWS